MDYIKVHEKWRFSELKEVFEELDVMACTKLFNKPQNSKLLRFYSRFIYIQFFIASAHLLVYAAFVANDLLSRVFYCARYEFR